MKVFLAGSTGVIGRCLLPLLVENGHEVAALVRSPDKARQVEAFGAHAIVANALDRDELTSAVKQAEPEVVIHQLTGLANAVWNFNKFDKEFALTNRFRSETADTLLSAARLVHARRFIAQSFCGWPFAREGGPIKTEQDPLDPHPPSSFAQSFAAIRHVEQAVTDGTDIEAFALRYGLLYGPGTAIAKDGMIVDLVRKRQFPIAGNGGGIWSFIHVQDAAQVTAVAVSRGTPGTYNIVDDEPAPVSSWLPFLANVVGAKPPYQVPTWLARFMIGEGGVSMMTQVRGGSNAKAKREFGWQLIYPTWRIGFAKELG